MPLVLADRVRDTTTTTGTGTVTLSGTAPTGYQNFSVIGNGNTTYYTINAGSQWEVGIGTYSSTGPTLSRDTVLSSSAGGTTKVDFAAGTKDVFVTYPSGEAVYQDGASIAAGTAVLPVANGGTGVTTSTGTGSVVLSNSPTLVTPVLGAASATSIANALGTVSAPSYTFTGDLNTGIYSPAADTLAFVEGGVEVMRITSAGLVQINTTSGAGWLNVNSSDGAPSLLLTNSSSSNPYIAFANGSFIQAIGASSSEDMRFRAGGTTGALLFDTNSAERMRITSAGNVGIGTSSPSTKLDVVGAGIRAVTTTTTSAGSPLGSQIYLGDANFASSFALRGPGIGAVFDAGQAVAASLAFYTYSSATRNERMRLDPNGNLGVGTASPAARLDILGTTSDQLRLRTAATEEYRIGRNASTGLLDFYGSQTGFTGYVFGGIDGERMRITSAGRVGIGTASPTTQLEVYGGASGTFTSVAVGNAATALQLAVDTSNNAQIRTAQSVNMQFFTAGTERMRITAAGDVGIGTASPGQILDVRPAANNIVQIESASHSTLTGLAAAVSFSRGNDGAPDLAATFGWNNGGLAMAGREGLVFATGGTSSYSATVERMRILSTGEVGVNLTTPGTTFEVALSTSGSPGLRASRSAVPSQYIQMDIGGGASARLFATGSNKSLEIINNNTNAAAGTTLDSIVFRVPSAVANTTIIAMYLESSTANVGIGTTAPAGRVHAVNTYTNTSNTNFIADGNIPGLNLRSANGRFSLLASYGAANTSSIVLGTGTANPSTEAMRFDHSTGGVNVGAATPNAAAQLQVDSTTRGFLPPRMTTAQRDAIATPPNGLVLYNTSTDKLQVRAAGAWVDLH